MLFNSYEFIFIFFPILIAVHTLLKNYTLSWSHNLLILASLLFYALLDYQHLVILLFSALINYAIGNRLTCKDENKPWVIAGIVFNLGLLGGYKYTSFLASTIGIDIPSIAAPLGISFFTFHQLAYLIDIYQKRIQPTNFRDYALYVTFFPHLIAGPIMRYGQFSPQLQTAPLTIPYQVALFFFSIGLFKKVCLADMFAPMADRIFDAVKVGQTVHFFEAWMGLFAYTWQIYFDFSGYADMAIGLGLFFGIALPINFNSPYKATSISDFWRRWHISLSQFLRDYLYIPLGGNRYGYIRQMVALLLTMSLAGLWHGASWNFVIWGMMHGLLLVISHSWYITLGKKITIPPLLGWAVTFICVILLWVLFRAETISEALRYYTILLHPSLHFPIPTFQSLQIIVAGVLVFWAKPVIFWTNYTIPYPLTILSHPQIYGIITGIVFWLALKCMGGEVSRSFVYFVF